MDLWETLTGREKKEGFTKEGSGQSLYYLYSSWEEEGERGYANSRSPLEAEAWVSVY